MAPGDTRGTAPGSSGRLPDRNGLGTDGDGDADTLIANEKYHEAMNAENEEQAEFVVDLILKGENGAGGKPLMFDPPLGLTEENIQAKKDTISLMEERGQIPSGWEDHITFLTPSDIEDAL